MSTSSLPSYVAPSVPYTPSYTAEPQLSEQRLLLGHGFTPRPSSEFVKQSRLGGISLRLAAQGPNVTLPVYGSGSAVEGSVELAKPEGATSVEVKIEGRLLLKEIAEGGTTTHTLCLSKLVLWSKENVDAGRCPSSLPFCLHLPTTFSDGKDNYPLPPTHECHLSGVPGFQVTIDYAVSAVVHKAKTTSLLRIGNHAVSTPFVYLPRSRPAVPLPVTSPSSPLSPGGWRRWESVMKAQLTGCKDITAKLFIPASRVFCMSEPIPFHLIFESSAFSLANLLPFLPTVSFFTSTKQHTRIQVLRQSTVDVRNSVILGTKTDIWTVNCIGEGSFRRTGDGPDYISFSGEVRISSEVKVGGFRAGGFAVKDCIVLSVTPLDFAKAPFSELRQLIPIRLTTDSWSIYGGEDEYTGPPTPPEAQQEHHFSDYRETAR